MRACESGDDCVTSAEPSCAGKKSRAQRSGNLENAIKSQMPGLDKAQLSAEEFVETIFRIEVMEQRIPAEVCSPVYHPSQDSHWQVACKILNQGTVCA